MSTAAIVCSCSSLGRGADAAADAAGRTARARGTSRSSASSGTIVMPWARSSSGGSSPRRCRGGDRRQSLRSARCRGGKIVTRRLAGEYERPGKLPDDDPPACRRSAIACRCSISCSDGDYFALLAFIEMNQAHRNALEAIRGLVRDRRKVATSVGFGPRYLHSTGQAHKGGPNSGVFLHDHLRRSEDLPVPGQRYTFGTIKLPAGPRRLRSARSARPPGAARPPEGCRVRPPRPARGRQKYA